MKRDICLSLFIIALGMGATGPVFAHGRGGGWGGHPPIGGGHYGAWKYSGGFHGYPRAWRAGYGGVGFYFGSPWYSPWYGTWPWYYGPPAFYYPPAIVVPSKPPVYIEQEQYADWKYCENPSGYYPYVSACPEGWQSVPPQPQDQEPNFWYFCDNPQGYYPYVKECSGGWRKIPPQPAPKN